jgi:acetoin utilization deacetylase AcuC-like enzyme
MLITTDPRCRRHDVPLGFPERPLRLERVLEGLIRAGRTPRDLGPHADGAAAIARVHGGAYVERFRAAVERGDGLLDSADNPLVASTWDAAHGAVEATLHAADHAATGGAAFAAVRPPGHHAERSVAMGFCYFNNVAVAADHLLARHGFGRVAIFDFDVHHGNGTQHIFEERGEVLYASIHQYPFYPGTGAASEKGRGAGLGATFNVPLPAGCGDAEYDVAFGEQVLPALESFAPDALLLSAGFDAWQGDPLGGMKVTLDGYGRWGEQLGAFARRVCGGRLMAVLEGGYDVDALGALAEHFVAGVERGLG